MVLLGYGLCCGFVRFGLAWQWLIAVALQVFVWLGESLLTLLPFYFFTFLPFYF